MSGIDWDLLRFMYETYGASVESLAHENDTTVRMVEYVMEQQGWKRQIVAEDARDWTDIKVEDSEMLEVVQEKMNVLSLLKQHALNPKLQALETSLINKAIVVTQALDPNIPSTAESLQKLGNLLEKLKMSNPAIQAHHRKEEQGDSGNGIKIQIVTGFSEPKREAIEISAPTLPELADAPAS